MTPHDDRGFSLLAQAPPPRSLGVALGEALAHCADAAEGYSPRYRMLWRLYDGSTLAVRQECLVTFYDMPEIRSFLAEVWNR